MSWTLVMPEIVLAVAGLVILAVGMLPKRDTFFPSSMAVVGALLLTAVLVLGQEEGTAFGGQYVADSYSSFMKLLTILGGALGLLLALDWNEKEGLGRFEFSVLVLYATLGGMVMVSANDLMATYLGLELLSLPLYVIAAFNRDDARSSEAGLKYFVLGALASGLLLYGASLVYGFAGTTNFDRLAGALTAGERASPGLVVGIVFVIAALAFKVSAVPFHMWTPDVYEGAPTPVTAFFASAPKVAAMALLTRVAIEGMGPATFEWRQIVIFMALASTILGGVAAIGQQNIKRLLAYSSINNVGFALIGLAAATQAGVASVLFYMAVYVVMTLGTFLVVLRMRDEAGQPLESIDALSGLSRTRPLLAAAMAMFMFSLAGIPPLMGFWPKFFVFNAAVQADLTWLAAVGIATSVIGAYYYLKIVKIMYFDAPAPAFERSRDWLEGLLIAAAALFVSPVGYLLIAPIDAMSRNAAGSLF